MKKFLIVLLAGLCFTPNTFAATIFSSNYNSFYKNETRVLWPITVTATVNGEIGPGNGLNLLFDADRIKMLWDKVETITASGTAVDNGKIAATITPEYKNDYHVMHIPVLGTFTAGEAVTFTGIKMRAYKNSFERAFLQVDINGDLTSDAEDIARIEVVDQTPVTDRTPPYPPKEFTATLAPDLQSVTLGWLPSPDFDLAGMVLDRFRIRNGNEQNINLLDQTPLNAYVDTDIRLGDVITYRLRGTDGANLGEFLEKTIEVKAVTSANPPATEPPPLTETEQLNNLFGYYKIRYSIKCHPAGRFVSETDSACLWAKIDLVYAQEKLGKNDVQVGLSYTEKTLIAKRLSFSEARYETNCANAETPAKYCTALGKALARAHYLLEQK